MWMHNNFLLDRSGKMSKSSGEFLRVQLLIDKGSLRDELIAAGVEVMNGEARYLVRIIEGCET